MTLRCPECGEPVEPPRVAYWGAGEYAMTCPNGHDFVILNVFRPAPPDEPDES